MHFASNLHSTSCCIAFSMYNACLCASGGAFCPKIFREEKRGWFFSTFAHFMLAHTNVYRRGWDEMMRKKFLAFVAFG